MYLHIGGDTSVRIDEIVGIFDMDSSTVGKATKDFLNNCEKKGEIIPTSDDLPTSFVVCEKSGRSRVYLSQISSVTLGKRRHI